MTASQTTTVVAVGQPATVPGDIAANLHAITSLTEEAAHAGSDLLVLPELCLGGYDLRGIATHPDRHVVTVDGDELATLRRTCETTGTALILGAAVRRPGGDVINAAVVVTAAAPVEVYAKRHLWKQERSLFTPGDELCVVEVAGLRVGLSVCYDAGFPEHMRALALADVDLITCPGAFAAGDEHRRFGLYMPLRALENTVWVAAANAAGTQGGSLMAGGSVICDPWGRISVEVPATEQLRTHELDLDDVAAAREQLPYLRDRRSAHC